MTVTLESLRKSIGKKKVNTQAFAWLADFERESGDLDTSLERVDGGLTLYPRDLAARLVRTKILFEKENYEGCIEECAKVLKMDPFCLSAQKRMGDAYDKLEKVSERNQCYRKVHDMDPLDQFWKDEYDVVAAATAAAAGAELGEMDLSMPGLESADAGSSVDFTMGGEAPFFEKSPEEAGVPEEKGPKFGSGFEFVNEASDVATATAEPESAAPETTAFESLAAEASNADDPFAALSALIPDSDAGDEAAMDSLQASLDSAMESINAEEPSAPEVFPADDDISGGDVNSAMSNFFGVDDDLEPEEPAAPASPFSNLNLSAGIDDEPAAAENANKVFSSPAPEDKPQSVDDAFGSIFGEDELPEEPSATAAPAADKPQSIDDAFGDIFGEDELPEEPAAFQKSAEVEPPAEVEPAVAEAAPAAPAADKPQSIDDAFGDIFGEDELPEEPAAFQKSADESMNLTGDAPAAAETVEPAADELSLAGDDSLNLDDTPVDASDWSPFQKSAETTTEETPAEEAPASGDSLFEKSAETEPAKEESSDSVGGAFDSLFGADEDLPEESSGLFQKSAETSAPSIEAAEPAAETLPEEPAAELEMPAEETKEVESSVDNAFSSIFGSDDDLPQEDLAVGGETATTEELPAAEPVAEVPGEEPAVEPATSAESFSQNASDFEKEMGGAFDSLFGSEEESTGAAVEEKNISTESLEEGLDKSFDNLFGESDDVAADVPVEEKPAAPQAEAATPKTDFDNLESEVSGAFKGLFESDDDDLPVEKPSNKGVDFLMSGDSDDEVSAGLVKDPSASLDSVNADLEASQNTRTMAEIYL
jgi:tetratricopeptide (TPR) repeat protein